MRDLTSTKREFTAVARRLYRRKPLSISRAFRGVTEPVFSVWIREHWAVSRPGWFRPVAREFQSQQKLFQLVNWPRPTQSGETKYTFSPTIQLTCFPQQTNNLFFEIDSAGVFQTLSLKNISKTEQLFQRTSFGTTNFVASIDGRTYESRVVDRIFRIFNQESHTRQSTKLKEFLSSVFSTMSRTVGVITRGRVIERGFRSESQGHKGVTYFPRDFALLRQRSATTEMHNQFVALQPLITLSSPSGDMAQSATVFAGPISTPNRWLKTTRLHTGLGHSFLTSRENAQGEADYRSAPNVFTTLTLNFAAPKVSEAELVTKRVSQFVSSPALTYLKRQEVMSEGIINALRAIQTSHVPSTTITAPSIPSIEQLTSQVRMQLERELRIERERRGL